MSEYTPDTEEVREDFTCALFEGIPSRAAKQDADFDWDLRAAQFDRWLAEHDRQVAEEAVDEYERQISAHIEMWGTTTDVEPWPINEHRKESE